MACLRLNGRVRRWNNASNLICNVLEVMLKGDPIQVKIHLHHFLFEAIRLFVNVVLRIFYVKHDQFLMADLYHRDVMDLAPQNLSN